MRYVIKKGEAEKTGEHGISQFTEYDAPFVGFSMGVSEIHGRYPSEGYDVDTDVDAQWFVASGGGAITVGGSEYAVEEGDMIFVPKGEKFRIDGNHLKLVVTSSPPWTPEQHKHVKLQ